MMEFGKYVKKLREQRGLTQDELASLSDLSASFISLVETGKRKDISADSILKFSKGLKVPVGDFYKITQSDKAVIKDAQPRSFTDAFLEIRNIMPVAVPVIADMHAPGRIMEYLYIPKPQNGHKDFYAIKIKGDCLEPLAGNGDFIIIDKEDAPDIGKSILCYNNGADHPCILKVKKPDDVKDCDIYGVILWIMKKP